jgi:hypothetical protein
MRAKRLTTATLPLIMVPAMALAAPCPKYDCSGDPAAWSATTDGAQQPHTAGRTIRTWHPDNLTTCAEARIGSQVSRSVIVLGAAGSSLVQNPSPALWEAMGCNEKAQPSAAPVTWDSFFGEIEGTRSVVERRKARAAAKGIKLCDSAEFLVNPNDCVRRARLADAP